MIKFRATQPNGRPLIGIGLTEELIAYLVADTDHYIGVRLDALGLDIAVDVAIFAGLDENTIASTLNISADTIIHDHVNPGGG